MNRSRCIPPPALCLRFPALQAWTEDLPLVLQRPDNFPLVMGILQEINQEKVGSSSGAETTQRPQDQQVQTLRMSDVKLESVDVEDHHQNLYSINPDLYQEWSLKGAEELLTDPEELQLSHDCYWQAHDAAADLEASALDEKPLFGLQSVHSQLDQRALDQARLLVDEKLPVCLQPANCLREQISLQEKALLVEDNLKGKEGLDASQAANCKPHHTVQQLSQLRVEDILGLESLQVVKREPGGHDCCTEARTQEECFLPDACTINNCAMSSEGHVCCTEARTQEEYVLPDACTINNCAMSSEKEHSKGNKVRIAPWSPKDNSTDSEIDHCRKITLPGHRKIQSSGLPESDLELQLQTGIKRRWTVHNILRSTSAILALPAKFTEQEKNHPGKDFPQELLSTSKSLAAEGPACPTVSSPKGADSPNDLADFKVEDRKHQSVSFVAERDCCELTLSLASSQPQTANADPHFLDCHALQEEKPVVKTFIVQEEHCGQCQRTNANQWQQATKRCRTRDAFRSCGQNTMPALNQKQLFPLTKGCMLTSSLCSKDGEGLTEIMENISKSFEHNVSSLDETHEKNVQNTVPLSKEEQLLSPTTNCIKLPLNGDGSRRTLRLMPESVNNRGSALEERGFESEDDQLADPSPPTAMESLHNSSQAEQASEFNEPHKKRMRGTLPLEEKGDGVQKEKDTRCHRSDGKSWRCVRECINGAYYCQYHLRARRIGYNRRKKRDV